ncbi:MAG: hypothetical protein ACPGXL_09995, partial [Chitinophagales bacterium]
MKHLFFLLLTFFTLSFYACEEEPTFEELYAGSWNMIFDGDFSGEKLVIIKSDGSFSFSITIAAGILGIGEIINDIEGTVSETGLLEGDIFMNGDDIGDFTGTLKDTGIGDGVYTT